MGQGPAPRSLGDLPCLTLPCPCPLGWCPCLSMVAACCLGSLLWCQAHLEEPASFGTHGPANEGVMHLSQPDHLMGDRSQMI